MTCLALSSAVVSNDRYLARKFLPTCSTFLLACSVEDPYGSSTPPLWQTATFKQPNATSNGPYDYTRSGNPTRCAFWATSPVQKHPVNAEACM